MARPESRAHTSEDHDLRARAEQIIAAAGGPVSGRRPSSESDTLRAPQLHEIELELQCEELKRTQLAAEAARERYFDLFEHAPVGYVTIDAAGNVREANQTFRTMTGAVLRGLVGQPFARLVVEEDQDIYYHQRMRLGVEAPQGSEVRLGRVGGEALWVRLASSRAFGPAGEAVTRVAVTDISELKRVQAALEVSKVAADAANQAKSQFLANMSHELRTPLCGMIPTCELLLDGELVPEQRELAEILMKSSQGLLGVIGEILDYAKIEAGRMTIERIAFMPAELVQEVRDLMTPAAMAKKLRLTTLLPPVSARGARVCLGDPAHLREILLNLVGNALKFTSDGEVTLSLTMRPGQAGEPGEAATARVFFGVGDTGIGMSADEVLHLGEPFRQADGSIRRRFGGTGLGVAICQRLLGLMGSRLEVRSRPGFGSHFGFTLDLETRASGSVA